MSILFAPRCAAAQATAVGPPLRGAQSSNLGFTLVRKPKPKGRSPLSSCAAASLRPRHRAQSLPLAPLSRLCATQLWLALALLSASFVLAPSGAAVRTFSLLPFPKPGFRLAAAAAAAGSAAAAFAWEAALRAVLQEGGTVLSVG